MSENTENNVANSFEDGLAEKSQKYDIVYGFEDSKGEFVEEGVVEEGLEDSYPDHYDSDGRIDDINVAHEIALEMNKAAEQFHADDVADGTADPNGPVIHKVVPAEETEVERDLT